MLALYGRRGLWECILGLGAILKPVGLFVCIRRNGSPLGLTLRTVGLAISGFWWASLAVSVIIGAPPLCGIAAMPLATLSLTALWVMVRSLAVPHVNG